MAIEHSMVSKSIERAQKKVEEHNFEIRKHLLEYDEVMDQQRKTIYTLRQDVLEGKNLRGYIFRMMEDSICEMVAFAYDTKNVTDEENPFDLAAWFKQKFDLAVDLNEVEEKNRGNVEEYLLKKAVEAYEIKESTLGKEQMENIAQILLMEKIDTKWKDHLYAMDHLRSGIGLRGYAQVDPKIEYKREALGMFESMNLAIRDEVTDLIFKLQIGKDEERKAVWHPDHYVHQEVSGLEAIQESPVAAAASALQSVSTNSEEQAEQKPEPIKVGIKIGRNQPCTCGSGRKFKQCCGRVR